MASVTETWNGLTNQAKVGMGVGVAIILAATVGVAVWAYRPDYQVLFADLSSGDAASMTAELDRLKVPYQLSDGGNTILVPKEAVYKTRLKVMGKDLPLHGAVGFEVFNNADFGMTEFVQKVNYQRAIQGELTRTILSIDEIQSARVHLAIAEQGLFKKAVAKPKASVTLVMKPGKVIGQEQVAGIQRLVAASVPEIVASDVTVLDQHGIALTRNTSGEPGAETAVTQLDSKRSAEDYLTRKVAKILDSTFGEGGAVATVDVALNMDQNRVTTEEVLPSKNGSVDAIPTGVVVREKQTSHDAGSNTQTIAGHDTNSNGITSTESDYQVGRRVEQVVTAPGSTRRLTIAVVVKKSMDEAQIANLREVVSLAVGFNSQRGDAVVIYSMDKLVHGGLEGAPVAVAGHDDAETQQAATDKPPGTVHANLLPGTDRTEFFKYFLFVLGAVVLAIAVIVVLVAIGRGKRRPVARHLSPAEKEQMLQKVRSWIDSPSVSKPLAGARQ
ncbi:flagellar basal-body MS-ring/collar protein FliF [Undibacterium sp. TJN25]|uniref:flagellar basal-body MS-ring/collar protein FliF n=1 Tax=Undibacterium sp. TJN25 TaxID=3413056 RepID=UPI003BF290A2